MSKTIVSRLHSKFPGLRYGHAVSYSDVLLRGLTHLDLLLRKFYRVRFCCKDLGRKEEVGTRLVVVCYQQLVKSGKRALENNCKPVIRIPRWIGCCLDEGQELHFSYASEKAVGCCICDISEQSKASFRQVESSSAESPNIG